MDKRDRYRKIADILRNCARKHESPNCGSAITREGVLDRRAADAIEDLLAENDALRSSYRVETPLGALIAKPSPFLPDYPGIWIELRRPDSDQDLTLALVEVTKSEPDLPPGDHIITRVYGDSGDEYTHRIVHEGIEDFFKFVD